MTLMEKQARRNGTATKPYYPPVNLQKKFVLNLEERKTDIREEYRTYGAIIEETYTPLHENTTREKLNHNNGVRF